MILPGLVDIHNHGAMAHDYMESTDAAFDAISSYLAEHGVTTAHPWSRSCGFWPFTGIASPGVYPSHRSGRL